MDYKAFYAEIADWINQCNQTAMQHGMNSKEFWDWVMNSSRAICEKYNNDTLVTKQMVMLYAWLEEVYEKSLGR